MIPRTLHTIWVGPPMPEWVGRCIASWERPGWECRHWDEAEIDRLRPFRNEDIYEHANELAPDHVGQLRSDIVRLELLWRYGGVYADADCESVRPLDDLLDVKCFAAWVTDRFLNNAVMGAVPGHPFIERLIKEVPKSVERNRGRRPNRMTGPHLLTRIWRAHPEGVTTYPRKFFYPVDWTVPERSMQYSPAAYCRHHWLNQRRERGIPSPA